MLRIVIALAIAVQNTVVPTRSLTHNRTNGRVYDWICHSSTGKSTTMRRAIEGVPVETSLTGRHYTKQATMRDTKHLNEIRDQFGSVSHDF